MSNNHADVLDRIRDLIREGKGDREVTYRQQLVSNLGSHNMPAEVVHKAEVYGLRATLDSGKGVFSRSHLVITRGTARDTWVFWTAMLMWLEANA